ncbi:hypothetical protein M758_11G037500 [Ceratodon purpureus]|nr:hypothetical protein M758_11G037500 [Ceratodon purpureus]
MAQTTAHHFYITLLPITSARHSRTPHQSSSPHLMPRPTTIHNSLRTHTTPTNSPHDDRKCLPTITNIPTTLVFLVAIKKRKEPSKKASNFVCSETSDLVVVSRIAKHG